MSAPKGNTNNLRHGGAAARKALTANEEFLPTSPARAAELAVMDEYNTVGRKAIIQRNARRLQAISDLYFGALVDAAERGDKQARDSYVKIFGSMCQAANRAWVLDREETAEDPNTIDYEKMLQQEREQ